MTRAATVLCLAAGVVLLAAGIAVNFLVTPFGLGSFLVVPGGVLTGVMAARLVMS